MTDDIVWRLRTTLAHAEDIYDTMNQAADEIERLRAELDHWQHIAKTLGDGYSLTAEIRPALQEVYMKFYASSQAVMDAI